MSDVVESNAAAEEGVTVELSADDAAAIFAAAQCLRRPLAPEPCEPPCATLESQLAATGAPASLESAPEGGRRLVATRAIAAGEVILEEDAIAWALSRSPGCDGLYALSETTSGRVVAALPPWHVLRTFRDSLSFNPSVALAPEAAYATLHQLTALGGGAPHAAWSALPAVAPGARGGDADGVGPSAANSSTAGEGAGEEEEDDDAIPARVQLLQAIAQCNAFSAALPADDSPWKRALLWPLLGRLRVGADRERLFDDPTPFSAVSALFPLGALFNHACGEANVGYEECAWEEGAPAPHVRFVARRAIAAGEELCHSYISGVPATAERRKKLLLTYRFACACAACVADEPLAGTAGDPLAAHFPNGVGAEGIARFYANGGRYPTPPDADLPVEP